MHLGVDVASEVVPAGLERGDPELLRAMFYLWERMKIIVEPTDKAQALREAAGLGAAGATV